MANEENEELEDEEFEDDEELENIIEEPFTEVQPIQSLISPVEDISPSLEFAEIQNLEEQVGGFEQTDKDEDKEQTGVYDLDKAGGGSYGNESSSAYEGTPSSYDLQDQSSTTMNFDKQQGESQTGFGQKDSYVTDRTDKTKQVREDREKRRFW